ncbi:DUF5694 domain-containing protein [Rheinheimera maricola]|uniref:DUF5694 domain-containing protein n=1 Tax=Rheinheimera maricola TaxID=2793282 RepID=A0ABS7X9U4_9GAMM|nr:DUF5694 domain-containing protein [Rheinheimera maricola]MBZ9611850.1 DUF5694 domain-containing protein [Rheinheimera maricola]
MKHILFLLVLCLVGCSSTTDSELLAEAGTVNADKIKVLNIGSFHFGATSDANKVEFDEHDLANQQAVRNIAKLLAQFKPTIVCLEFLPEDMAAMNQAYQAFLANPEQLNTRYGELSMLGFDIARLSGVEKVYGIDHHLGYNYSLGDFIENSPELENAVDRQTYLQLTHQPFLHYPKLAELNQRFEQLPLLEQLQLTNQPLMLDYSLNTNADKLFYVGIGDGFEGAEQAAQFYLRNMKIYTNLNRIPMSKDDRVLILMGSAHTAMLREFIRRSPKFDMVNTLDYLTAK